MKVDIVFVIHDMRGGGAQRVALNLIEAWIRQGLRVQVITWLAAETDFFKLPAGVQRTVIGPKPLGAGRVAAHLFNIRAIFCIRRHLRESRPKVVVSFITVTNIFVILASAGLKCRLVISERNDPTRQRAGPIWATLRRGLYRFADVVTANTAHAVEAMVDYVPRRKLVAVHNPVVLPGDIQSFKRSSVVLNVGRLVPQKNQRLIVEAIALLGIKSQDWRMELVGEGPDRDDLVGLAERKGLSGLVNMQGSVADPDPHYRAAGIFVLSSVYEGTPNVLLEAMAHAVPCIVSDSLPGALEYVEDGVSGLIFRSGDSTHLAECLLKLIENPDLRLSLGREGRKRVENYSVEIVLAQWNRLLFPSSDAGIRSDRTGAV
jgi:glycosyltransferase involved in cell wall biosynthesis